MIKMSVFDKVNDKSIVDTFKNVFQRSLSTERILVRTSSLMGDPDSFWIVLPRSDSWIWSRPNRSRVSVSIFLSGSKSDLLRFFSEAKPRRRSSVIRSRPVKVPSRSCTTSSEATVTDVTSSVTRVNKPTGTVWQWTNWTARCDVCTEFWDDGVMWRKSGLFAVQVDDECIFREGEWTRKWATLLTVYDRHGDS